MALWLKLSNLRRDSLVPSSGCSQPWPLWLGSLVPMASVVGFWQLLAGAVGLGGFRGLAAHAQLWLCWR